MVTGRGPADTEARQERASNPAASAWVSANAGAGKTTVLVRRVIRLLLDGTPPARILCLTFTRAAAANMANRVLDTLGRWVQLEDTALDAEMRAVSSLEPDAVLRAQARRLFAAALETPGGLKVQTIHAFCDRVLHQFPFEARVPADFEVLDEVREADLLQRSRQAVLVEAANDPDGELGRALTHAVTVASDRALQEALTEAIRDRRKVMAVAARDPAAALGVPPGDRVEDIEARILASPHLPQPEWSAAAAALELFGGNARLTAGRLLEAAAAPDPVDAIDSYFSVFFTDDGKPRSGGGLGNAEARRAQPDLYARLVDECERLAPLRELRLAARARARTQALFTLASAAIRRYEDLKRARGALDYTDLIARTAEMLSDVGASWVLYKLDGGIDHVLIDEAQDTSPEQWRVIEKLTEEFFAGRGAHEGRHASVFAVGDEKQSIFGFQGAEPRRFEAMRREFLQRATAAGRPFHSEELKLSFRSAPGVLEAIDAVFAQPDAFRGLSSGDAVRTVHEAIRTEAPALVELWPVTEPEPEDETDLPWDAPVDAVSESSPEVRLAARIAAAVKFWLAGGLVIGEPGKARVPRAGDVIVLVRRRGPLFESILKALKRADVPVAGADRLRLADHIAVMDLMALGDALLLERDDLSLASVLKSPLFGLSEDDLYVLARGRSGSLAAALAARSHEQPAFRDAAERLSRWRREAAELRPYDFYSLVLGRDHGRRRMLARFGIEAADALDEFLARALAYEQLETPSLAGLLAFQRRAQTEVKRDLEVESDAVRVMTTHGAKGLEAPVIVLADTTQMLDGRLDSCLLALPDERSPEPQLVWALAKGTDSQRLRTARDAAADSREAEYRRLLYVALTRAADALVVCGHRGRRIKSLPEGCWYELVRKALEPKLREEDAPGFEGKVWRWRQGAAAAAHVPAAPARMVEPPAWLRVPVPAAPARRRLVASESADFELAPRGSGIGRSDALRRGELIHRLLQFLPQEPQSARSGAARRFLEVAAIDLTQASRDALASEAIRMLDHPALAPVLTRESGAEIAFAARLPGEIVGRIDRLAIAADAVWIADFKTDAVPPQRMQDVPVGYVRQLALYRAAIQRILPGRAVRALLAFTSGPAVFEIEAERLDAAITKE